MNGNWEAVAERAADALAIQPGEVIQVRDRTGRYEVVQEMLLAVERRGATALPELLPPDLLHRLLMSTDPALLARWDQHRRAWLERVDRVLVLAGSEADLATVPAAAVDAWRGAAHRLTLVEEHRLLPCLIMAVPTAARAEGASMSLAALEEALVPALVATPHELQTVVDRTLAALQGGQRLTVHSDATCVLHLALGDRRWLSDTGSMPPAGVPAADVQTVLNLPAGSVYTTVVESATQGSLWLPQAGEARDLVLRFAAGRVVAIEAAHALDGERLTALFDRHSGEPRRVSHIGIGLNPYLRGPLGWALVDEHQEGCLFLALGENRYLGGENASSLNVDYAIPAATLAVDGHVVVERGRMVAW